VGFVVVSVAGCSGLSLDRSTTTRLAVGSSVVALEIMDGIGVGNLVGLLVDGTFSKVGAAVT